MNITNAELKNALDLEVSQLEKEAEQMLTATADDEYMSAITSGLQLKTTADLFTKSERNLLGRVEKLQRESFRLLELIQDEALALIKAEREAQGYESRIGEPIEVLRKRNQKDHMEASDIVSRATKLSSIAKANGWNRYTEMLKKNPDRALKEAKAIVDSLNIIEAINPIPNVDTMFQFPQALHAEIETDTYIQRRRYLTPQPFSEMSKAEQTAAVSFMLSPLLYHHRKALEEDIAKTALLNSYIEQKRTLLASEPTTEVDADNFASYLTSSIDTYSFPHDKISNHLTRLIKGETQPLALENRNDKKKGNEITTNVTLDFDTIENSSELMGNWQAIDPYDREIINAIFTIWIEKCKRGEIVDGEAITTLQTIYRVLAKDSTGTLRLPKEKESELEERLMKLNSAKLYINADAEVKYYKALGEESVKAVLERKGQLMSIVMDKAKINGALVDNVVHIIRLDLSPLYLYAKIKGQIESVPIKKLDAKSVDHNAKTIVKTAETISVEGYLIRRITAMEHISSTIVIDTILNEVGIYKQNYSNFNKKRSETIKKIENILNGYVRTGYIKSFEFKSKGRVRYYSVVIKK